MLNFFANGRVVHRESCYAFNHPFIHPLMRKGALAGELLLHSGHTHDKPITKIYVAAIPRDVWVFANRKGQGFLPTPGASQVENNEFASVFAGLCNSDIQVLPAFIWRPNECVPQIHLRSDNLKGHFCRLKKL